MKIISNGSHWAGEGPSSIDELIEVLGAEVLDPTFEDYGQFVIDNGDGTVRLFGNFLTVSHVFNIDGTRQELQQVIDAIQRNRQTDKYQQELAVRAATKIERETEERNADPFWMVEAQ